MNSVHFGLKSKEIIYGLETVNPSCIVELYSKSTNITIYINDPPVNKFLKNKIIFLGLFIEYNLNKIMLSLY